MTVRDGSYEGTFSIPAPRGVYQAAGDTNVSTEYAYRAENMRTQQGMLAACLLLVLLMLAALLLLLRRTQQAERQVREMTKGVAEQLAAADERARENLHLMVAPFILRRMKKDVLTDLPEKVESVMESELTAEQRRVYAAYAARLIKESEGGLLTGQDRMRMLSGLTHLRQLYCDPRLCLEGYTGGSGKLEQLCEVVHDAIAGGHRLLIFSQFTSMLALIRERLEGEGVTLFVLTGETDKEERMRLVTAFNEGGAQAFLISLKAGGTGLNLTGADVVIHYDPWWNMAAQNQATDRAYRIGQTRGVQVIRMIASGTVEERILTLQESKQQLGDGVLLGEETLFNLDADVLRKILR